MAVASVVLKATERIEADGAGLRILRREPERALAADRGLEAGGIDDRARVRSAPGKEFIPVAGEQRLHDDGPGPVDTARREERFIEGDLVRAERGVARMSDRQRLFDEFDLLVGARELRPASRRLQVQRAIRVEAQLAREARRRRVDRFFRCLRRDLELQGAESRGDLGISLEDRKRQEAGAGQAAAVNGDLLPMPTTGEGRRKAGKRRRGGGHGGEQMRQVALG